MAGSARSIMANACSMEANQPDSNWYLERLRIAIGAIAVLMRRFVPALDNLSEAEIGALSSSGQLFCGIESVSWVKRGWSLEVTKFMGKQWFSSF